MAEIIDKSVMKLLVMSNFPIADWPLVGFRKTLLG